MDYTDKIRKIDNYLKLNLSHKRYTHSVEVAKMSSRIALLTGNNIQEAYLGGLSHDVAREFKKSQLLDSFKNNNMFSKEFCLLPQLFHGPVGADFLLSKMDIINNDILDSVRYHSIGFPGLGNIAKVVYVADYISLDRKHISDGYRSYVLRCSLNKMVILVVDKNRRYLISRGETILPETDSMYKKIMRILSEKET